MPEVEHWILGCAVSCTKMRASIKGLAERAPNHTCIVGSSECTHESAVLPHLQHFSDQWPTYIGKDLRLPGENCVRYVVELESDTDREKLEAKLPMAMPENLMEALGRFLDEPTVFLRRSCCYDHDGDSLTLPEALAERFNGRFELED